MMNVVYIRKDIINVASVDVDSLLQKKHSVIVALKRSWPLKLIYSMGLGKHIVEVNLMLSNVSLHSMHVKA